MARPKRGNYAYGPEGEARYKKNLREYLKKQKEAREKKTKIDSTKKNIDKQKTANKKATTTKTTKGTTTTKPKSTAAKGKSLATGKTTSKTKAAETTKTTTAKKTVTKTVTKKPTTKKPAPKKPAPKKPAPKKPAPKKPAGKVAASSKTSKNLKIKGDRYVRKPVYTKENYGKTVKSTNTTGSTVKGQIKQGIDSGVKKGKEVASQVKQSGKKFGEILKAGNRQKNPKATNPQQKLFQTINQGGRKLRILSKKYLRKNKPFKTAAGKVIQGVKNNPGSVVRGAKNITKGGIYTAIAGKVFDTATKPLQNRVDKSLRNLVRRVDYGEKPLTLEESNALTKKLNNMSRAEKKALREQNKIKREKYRQSKKTNTSNQSSTTKNINKQKTSNNNKLKVSNVSQRDKDLREAKKRVRKAKGYNKEKLQREVRYLEKFGKQGRTWSNPVGAEGNNKPSSVKTEKPKEKLKSKFIRTSKGTLARRGTATAQRAENKERARKRAQEMARERKRRKQNQ